jgi:hypothetical protein
MSALKFESGSNLERELGRHLTRVNLFKKVVEGNIIARSRITSSVMSKSEAEESAKKAGVDENYFIKTLIRYSQEALD